MADSPEVIPLKVDQHDMFRAFLFIDPQLIDQSLIVGGVFPARPGSRDRPRIGLPSSRRTSRSGEELMRREMRRTGVFLRKGKGSTAEGDYRQTDRGVVEGPRERCRPGHVEPVGEVGLIDVTGCDVFLAAAHVDYRRLRLLRCKVIRRGDEILARDRSGLVNRASNSASRSLPSRNSFSRGSPKNRSSGGQNMSTRRSVHDRLPRQDRKMRIPAQGRQGHLRPETETSRTGARDHNSNSRLRRRKKGGDREEDDLTVEE